ncbi:Fc receptor-like protein 5, partial [Silurus asotus]
RPKPVVNITPGTHVFSGENVTFKCEVQGEDTEWTYNWYKKDNRNPPFSTTQEFSRDSVTDSDSGEYTCSGRRHNDSQSSEISDPVTLTVSGKPKPVLTSTLQEVLTGNSVTLTCTLNLQSEGWKFYWRKPTQSRDTESKENHYSIRSVSVSDGGQYWCRAERGNPVHYTQYSDALSLKVTESPKPVVKIQPDTHVFRNEKVTFRCEFQGGGDSVWIYDWYRDNFAFYPNHPHHPYPTTQEFSISSITDSSRGKYTCRGRRRSDNQISQTSDSVTLTVSEKPKPLLTSNLTEVLTGNSVTLSCTLNLQSEGWKFYWSKNTQSPDTETESKENHYSIRPVSVSDGGQYWCSAGRGKPVYYTQYSDALSIKVIARPKPAVKIHPAVNVFIGETVTLTCDIQTGGSWKYHWYRSNKELSGAAGNKTYTITDVKDSNKGPCSCKGTQSSDPKYTQSSDAVTLTV